MTMFPVHRQNLRKKNSFGCYGGACGGGGRYLESEYDCFISLGGASDLMAEDESRTEISINDEEAAGSSSKDIHHQEISKDDDGGWLQLSLGGGHAQTTSQYYHRRPDHQITLGPRLIELDLLPGGSSGGGDQTSSQQMMMRSLALTAPATPQHLSFQVPDFRASLPTPPPTFFLQQQHRGSPAAIDSAPAMTFANQQYDNSFLPFRPYPLTLNPHLSSSPSSLSASLEQPPAAAAGSGSYHGRPLHFHTGLDVSGPLPPPRMDLRVVDPPRRPHSGVWFILQASQNQTKEPYLPQVPKSYLRIKDGRMTVGLLIKYLVNKLKLDNEFEVEITCKGQQLLPFLTLQHVRDNIWNSPRNEVVYPHSSATIDHLMLLNYGRIP